jgi:hypothetical protein
MMKWRRKAWSRAELEKLVGPPAWEANDESRVEYRDGAVHMYSNAVQKHATPPAAIDGVDRWIAWECARAKPFDAQTLDVIERLQRGTSDQILSQAEADALVNKVKDHFNHATDHCSAATRMKSGEPPDKWFMSQVCSRHRELED